MRRFYLDASPSSDLVCLTGEEANHIRRVLRLKRGDALVLFDAAGSAYSGVLAESRSDGVTVRIRETFAPEAAACRAVVLQAVLKAQRMDLIVQKSTELGCCRIVPFFSSRCIPRWDAAKEARRQHHWQQIAVAAVKQSGVRRLPVVEPPCDFETALASAGRDCCKVLLWEGEQSAPLRTMLQHGAAGPIVFAVGPEGGFTEAEVDLARACGFRTAGLGKTILRAETATLAVLAIIGYEAGAIG